jgi:hypothetical protein
MVRAAEPVTWREYVEQRLLQWKQQSMNRSGDQLALDDFMDKESLADLIDYVCDEWSHPPTAPSVALPPMPPGQMQGAGIDNGIVTWREDQLRAYGIAAQRLALDEAARVCKSRVIGDHNREDAEAARCAKAIRALMP